MTLWHTLGNFWRCNTENWIKIALLLILALAVFLRFYRLDAQSLWADEGNSVSLSGRSLDHITAGAAHDIHPPLYYYLLHFWMRIFSNSEFAVRSLSALLGTGLVYLTYLLGRHLSNYWLGLAAAFLAAISPFQVYYSQETRMYILLAALSALSVYSFIRFLEAEASKTRNTQYAIRNTYLLWAGLYIIATALSLYTHYSFPIIMAMENLLYGIWLAISWRQGGGMGRAIRWIVIQLAVVALYWPWLPTAFRQVSGWPSISQPHGLLFVVQEAFRLFSLGPTAGVQYTSLLLLGFAAIFIAGLGPITLRLPPFLSGWGWGWVDPTPTPALPLRGGGSERSPSLIPHLLINLLPPLYCLFPVLMMYTLSLWRPAYRPKFFLVGSPAFCLILARGIVRLTKLARWSLVRWSSGQETGRDQAKDHPTIRPSKNLVTRSLRPASCFLLPAACLIFITVASNRSLQNYYFDPQYARDDYRGIAQYISALERKGDAVLLNAPNQWEIFTYYYKGDSPVYPLPRSRPLDEAQTAEELTEIAAKHDRIFAILWAVDESDPGRFVEGWLAERAYKALDTWYGNVRLAIYAVPTASPREVQNPLDAKLGDEIALLGYNLLTREVEAGDILPLTLFWQALAQPRERYKVFVHILDEAGHIVGQWDSEPGDGLNITTIWQPGETVADNYGVLVRPGTPPGQHRIVVGMYSPISGQRLTVSEGGEVCGDHLLLDSIRVLRPSRPPSSTALKMQHEAGIQYDDLVLLGYSIYKLGYEHQPTEPIHPGDILHLDLYWRAFRPPQADWQLTLQLVDSKGNVLATQQAKPASVDYPTTDWELGEVVRGQYDIFIPPEAPRGRYRLKGQPTRLPGGQALRSPWVSQQFLIQ
jgi:4-amino-4-deoxy-L-arabinose transferase-like glycosyltransferase